jgi:hypothetical protein
MTAGRGEQDEGAAMDAGRDAHLREALRHAPDAGVTPPAALSEAILRQARLAAAAATPSAAAGNAERAAGRRAAAKRDAGRRGAARSSRSGTGFAARWASFWAWLMQPSVATGFAGLMVATLVGLMWWGRPIDEPLREAQAPETAPAVAAPAAPAAAPALPKPAAPVPARTMQAPATAAADRAARITTPETRGEATTAQRPAREDEAAKAAGPPPTHLEERGAEGKRKAETVLADANRRDAAPARPRPAAAPPAEAGPGAVGDAPAPPAVAAAPAPEPAPNTGAASPSAERRRDEAGTGGARAAPKADAAADAAGSADRLAKAANAVLPDAAPASGEVTSRTMVRAPKEAAASEPIGRAAQPAAGLALGARPAPAPAPASTPASATPQAVENPVPRLRAAVAAWPDVWTWQRGAGIEQPMNAALQAWLAQLDDATRSRWQAAPSSARSAASGSSQTLRLLRNGRLHSTVRIEAGAVRVESAGEPGDAASGVPRAAALPAGAAAALRSALEQAAP